MADMSHEVIEPGCSQSAVDDKIMPNRPALKTTKRLTFEEMNLRNWLKDQCRAVGISEPTPVQFYCVPEALKGRDIIGCSRTGTGKTLAFVLPILQTLADDPYGIFALVLTPTRELAFQIADQFNVIGKPINTRTCIVTGGRDMMHQGADMASKPHILVATPGRLMDHYKSGHEVPLDRMKILVLDEADRLLDGQFEEQLKVIFQRLPKKRQTLLFSATITDALRRLRELALREPYFFEDKQDEDIATVSSLTQRFILCPSHVRDAYLVYAVLEFCVKKPDAAVLIFAHSCRECQALALMFKELGMKESGSLHSMIPQSERTSTLNKFRSHRIRLLICTDVAARGLDITHVNLVVNHSVPKSTKTYIHRVGRAARAGRQGEALTCVSQNEVKRLQAIESVIGLKMEQLKVSDKKVAENVTEVLVAKREAEMKLDSEKFGESREINLRKQLLLEGVPEDEVDEYVLWINNAARNIGPFNGSANCVSKGWAIVTHQHQHQPYEHRKSHQHGHQHK